MHRGTSLTGTATVIAGTALAGGSDGPDSSQEAGDGAGSEPRLDILSHDRSIVETGTPTGVSGTVRNTTDAELEFAQVEAVFLDAEGAAVAEGREHSRTGVAAGEIRPFNCPCTGDEADRIEEYEVEASTTA